jgi:hypothetical protein
MEEDNMKKVYYVVARDTVEKQAYNGPIEVVDEGQEPIHVAIMNLIQDKVGREHHDKCQELVQRYQGGAFAVEILDRLSQYENLVSSEGLVPSETLVPSEGREPLTQSELADVIIARVKAVIANDDEYNNVELPEEITISLVNEDGITGYAIKLPKGAHKLAKLVVEAAMEDVSIADFAVVFGPKVTISTTDEENEAQ